MYDANEAVIASNYMKNEVIASCRVFLYLCYPVSRIKNRKSSDKSDNKPDQNNVTFVTRFRDFGFFSNRETSCRRGDYKSLSTLSVNGLKTKNQKHHDFNDLIGSRGDLGIKVIMSLNHLIPIDSTYRYSFPACKLSAGLFNIRYIFVC